MLQHNFASLLRFARTLKGIIVLGMSGFLLIIGIATGKAIAQSPDTVEISLEAAAQIQALVEEKESRTPAQQKISSNLLYTIKRLRGDEIIKLVPNLSTFVNVTADNKVRVDIKTHDSITTELLQQITATGATVLFTVPDYNAIQVLIPLTQIENIASIPEVRSIKPYQKPILRTGRVTSEGDIAHGAALARKTYAVDGSGVKIGVLSDSYNNQGGAVIDIITGDLPPNGVTLVGSGDQAFGGADEGRAMLQIVHDLAPKAQLYFATASNSEADFANNIRALRKAGCDIIVDDVGYFDEPVFQDGIVAQAVNTVTKSGALYFSAAGNGGNKKDATSSVWEGDFVNGGQAPLKISGTVHAFNTAPLTQYNRITDEGSSSAITLQWSDPWGQSANDYDLYVLNSQGTQVIAQSTNTQNGGQNPYEIVGPQKQGSLVIIVKHSSAEPRFLNLNLQTDGEGRLAINTNGQIYGHTAAVDAFSVAAVSAQHRTTLFTTAERVETFSSDGPRRIFYNPDGTPVTPNNLLSTGGLVRHKPDIAAADGVVTTLSSGGGLNPFFGTSAAAPHAAGVAALLKSFRPAINSAEIRTILTQTALDIEAPGFDEDSGYGIVMANLALQQAAQILPVTP